MEFRKSNNNKIIREKCYHIFIMSILVMLTFSQIVLAQSKKRLTLSEAVQIALQNNREIAILQKEIEKARGEKQTASRILPANPEIAGGVKYRQSGSQNLKDYEFSLSQTIEMGRQRHYRMKIAKLSLLKAEMQLQRERLAVTEKVKGIFIDLTALKEKLSSVQNIRQVEQDLLHWLSIRAANGEISSVTLNTARLEVLETEEKILSIQRETVAKRRELEWVMNTPLSEGVEIDCDWPEFPNKIELRQLQKCAEEHNPDIKLASLDFKKAEARVKLIKTGRMIPGFDLSLSRSREDRDNIVGVGLSIPLPLFNRKTGAVNAAKAQEEKAALELQRIHEKILSEINRYYKNFSTLKHQQRLFVEEILPITRQNLDQIKLRYQTGEIDIMTFERFLDDWIQAKIDYANFLQNYYHTLCQMELLVGTDLKQVVKKH